MDEQLYYDKSEGFYWYMDDGEPLFYGWADDVTEKEAESAIDRIAPEYVDEEDDEE